MSLKQVRTPLTLAASVALAIMAASSAIAGTPWTLQHTPSPAGVGTHSTSELTAVSCSAARACTAVGVATGTARAIPYAERWNGTAWALQRMPGHTPAGQLFINSVSCPASRDCVAVGEVGNGPGTSYHWNGSAWSQVRTAKAAPHGNLWAVSCPSTRTCIAVGEFFAGTLDSWFAERWNGRSWSLQAKGKADGVVTGLSCASASSCVATGGKTVPGGILPFAEHWNGRTWTSRQPPVPAGFPFAALGGVSCSSATSCLSVGAAQARTTGASFAVHWNGTRWSLLPAPPHADGNNPSQVSCLRDGRCAAVGFTDTRQGRELVLAETWDGARWTIEAAPNPSQQRSVLNAVSCVAASCEAVGGSQVGSDQSRAAPLAEHRR